MSDEVVRPEGSIRIEGEREGIAAGCSIYFVFDGDWANLYEDFPHDETEARKWFVQEVDYLLKREQSETREGGPVTIGQDSTEDRGE